MDPAGTVPVIGHAGGYDFADKHGQARSEWAVATGRLVTDHGDRVLTARSAAEAAIVFADAHVDLVIVEADAETDEALELLAGLCISHPEVIRVLVLGAAARPTSQAMARAAIFQCLRRPLDAGQLGLVVRRGLETRELARRHRLVSREFKFAGDPLLFNERHAIPMRAQSHRFERLVYVSERMAGLCELARKAARTELPILIQGETGTGKELLARAIHYSSSRRASPLMVQNCGGMPDELLQSELFGHKRGAFTGAFADRLGLFRAADGGTVLLDEISEVSASFQVSLLRFLQEGEVKPLGSDRIQTCDVRIIAASNRPLQALMGAGRFRQDLYFRLKGFELEVPPLRDRPDDIPALAEFFAAKHSEAIGRKILGISASAVEKLAHFEFPGNIREIENEISRMVALARDGEYLTTQHMSPALVAAAVRRQAIMPTTNTPSGTTLKETVENVERGLVRDALARHRWNQGRAAAELGLSRVGLANKIERYGLDHPSSGPV